MILEGGIQADLRVVSDAEFPFALAYFTGSKEHNIVMRQRAIQRGLRLNEYGLFRSKEETRDPALLVPCQTEEEIFAQLGLAYIPPELREDQGEFAAAEQGRLPRLLEWTDLRGSLHNHSNWSDGHKRSRKSPRTCDDWAAITGPSPTTRRSSFQANGLDAARLRQQIKDVQAAQPSSSPTRAATSASSPASRWTSSPSGKLDFDDDLLAELDVVVASLHQGFSQNEAETPGASSAPRKTPSSTCWAT